MDDCSDQDIGNLIRNKPFRLAASLIIASIVIKLGARPLGEHLGFEADELATMESAFSMVSIIGLVIGVVVLIRAILRPR